MELELMEQLRLDTLAVVIGRLEQMLRDHDKKKFFNKCPIQHISEMVKLYHQAKSLEKK